MPIRRGSWHIRQHLSSRSSQTCHLFVSQYTPPGTLFSPKVPPPPPCRGGWMWSSSSHIARGQGSNTQLLSQPTKTKQRPHQHRSPAPTTVSSASRDSSEPQRPLHTWQPPADGRMCHRVCGERQAYEVARQHPYQTLAGFWRTVPVSTKHRVFDVVEFKAHRKGSLGEYSGISRRTGKN